MPDNPAWEFWIDAGGTFTDCLARRPDGGIVAHKLLSTGRYLGRVAAGSTAAALRDRGARGGDPAGFFAGWTLACELPGIGAVETRVCGFDPAGGRLELDPPLPAAPPTGTRYELGCPGLEAPVIGIRWLLGRRLGEGIGPVRVRVGTTRATNALLERRGARVAFVTTAGFGDAPLIGGQDRADLFNLAVAPVVPMHEQVIELDERLDAGGRVLRALDEAEVAEKLSPLRAAGVEALAVCLLHGARNPRHERAVVRIARGLGFTQVSSSELAPLPKFIPRADTILADAYLTPVLRAYADRLAAQLPGADLRFMTSAGSLVRGAEFHGKDAILSGPAGGVVGAARVAARAGVGAIIAFDMGGTSTDVSRGGEGGDGEFARRYEVEIGGRGAAAPRPLRLLTPMLEVETVAAGGGSVCWFDGQKVAVGPRSAGAEPGPACYGRGGPLCVTDVNFFLGRIPRFPFALDREAVERRLDELRAQVNGGGGGGAARTREALAQGLLDVANATISAAIRKLAAARGDDVRTRTLVPFGGAGGQHACALARELGVRRVLCSPFAGVLSALGIGLTRVTRLAERSVGGELEVAGVSGRLGAEFAAMEAGLRVGMLAEGFPEGSLAPPRRLLELRYAGQEARLTVADPGEGGWRGAFEGAHRRLYGFAFADRAVEVYAARVELASRPPEAGLPGPAGPDPTAHRPAPAAWTRACFAGTWGDTPVHDRGELRPGGRFEGPAIVVEGTATVVIEPGWTATVLPGGDLSLDDNGPTPARPVARPSAADRGHDGGASAPDPVELELFYQRFASVAEQMGAVLQRTALSVNVKERLDFSCAVFDADGELVANAPHIPVHLGAMGECVRCLREDAPDPREGEVFITNDPFRGGSHLPDITVVTPVFLERDSARTPAGGAPQFYVAGRAHHAEIGGVSPGSMSPAARSLAEEGVLVRAFRHRPDDPASEERLRRVFLDAPYPTRNVEENLADLRAQVAANATGARLLGELAERHGAGPLRRYAGHLRRTTEAKMRAALARLPAGARRFADRMDDGTPIAVTVTIPLPRARRPPRRSHRLPLPPPPSISPAAARFTPATSTRTAPSSPPPSLTCCVVCSASRSR